MFGNFDIQWQNNVKIVYNCWYSSNRCIESQRLDIDDSCQEQMCLFVHEPIFNGHDLVSYILFDIYRKMCDNKIDEFFSIMNHAKTESTTHFIKHWLKTVGWGRTKIRNVLNWFPKGQGSWIISLNDS